MAAPRVRVRMYRQGLGDCFLLTFTGGSRPRHILIDCGTAGATTTGVRMRDVVNDIVETTGGRIDLLVVTHEHKDHVSGFKSERARFDEDLAVERVWVAWTEDPDDALALETRKYREDLGAALALAVDSLSGARVHDDTPAPEARGLAGNIRELLDFVGDLPPAGLPLMGVFAPTVHEAMTYATRRGRLKPRFLKPGSVQNPGWLPGVRFYVLGPPRDSTKLATLGKHGSPELYGLTGQFAADLSACATFAASGQPFRRFRESLEADQAEDLERRLPFDPRFRLEETEPAGDELRAQFASYFDDANAWRNIDYDWLNAAGELALQLDNITNNTSLVLAIELVADRRVLLFAADAQLGSWLSWHDLRFRVTDPSGKSRQVTAANLLERTVLYKVGHHASHNATVNEKGLELMRGDDLIALIPVDTQVATNKGWQMPAPGLHERLLEKTIGRVLHSDVGWSDADRPVTIPQQAWDEARAAAQQRVDISDLFVDVHLSSG
jgi:hypothetical protein